MKTVDISVYNLILMIVKMPMLHADLGHCFVLSNLIGKQYLENSFNLCFPFSDTAIVYYIFVLGVLCTKKKLCGH